MLFRTKTAKKLGTNTIIPTNNTGRDLDQNGLKLGYTIIEYKANIHQTNPAENSQRDGIFKKTDRTTKPAKETAYKKDLKDESPARLPHSHAQTPKTIEMNA